MTIDASTLLSDYESLSNNISTIIGLNKSIFNTEDEERLPLEIRQLVNTIKDYYPAKKLFAIKAEILKLTDAFIPAIATLKKDFPGDANAGSTLKDIEECTAFIRNNATLLETDPAKYINRLSSHVQNIHVSIGDYFPGIDEIILVRILCNTIFNMISGIQNSLDSAQLVTIFQSLVVTNNKLEAFKNKLKAYQKVIGTATSVIVKIIEVVAAAKQMFPFLAP